MFWPNLKEPSEASLCRARWTRENQEKQLKPETTRKSLKFPVHSIPWTPDNIACYTDDWQWKPPFSSVAVHAAARFVRPCDGGGISWSRFHHLSQQPLFPTWPLLLWQLCDNGGSAISLHLHFVRCSYMKSLASVLPPLRSNMWAILSMVTTQLWQCLTSVTTLVTELCQHRQFKVNKIQHYVLFPSFFEWVKRMRTQRVL